MPTLKVNDLEMYYTERGEGPPLVAFHAATAHGALMGWLADDLAKQGFNVITPDARGHGRTANPAPDLHLNRLVDDTIEFLYHLGRGPVHGLGYSMGGGMLLYAAKRHPDLFKSLALLGTSYHHATQERVIKMVGTPDQREGKIKDTFDPDTGIRVGWDAPVESFKSIPLPTLIMCADRDEFNDPEDSLELYRAMPNAELLVVPHTDHLGLVRHPMVHTALKDFYSRVPR
jgi:pimeloyl-ACP methyl ester carboxylesterase